MKRTIFTSLSAEKVTALLQACTSPRKKGAEDHVWKDPKHPKRDWVSLVGAWKGGAFHGKLYRSYKGQMSGGIALPSISLKPEAISGIGQLQFQTRFSNSFIGLILAFLLVTLLQVQQIIATLPQVKVVPIVVLVGWCLMCAMMFVLFYNQYQHECQAIELTVKTMVKAFDK